MSTTTTETVARAGPARTAVAARATLLMGGWTGLYDAVARRLPGTAERLAWIEGDDDVVEVYPSLDAALAELGGLDALVYVLERDGSWRLTLDGAATWPDPTRRAPGARDAFRALGTALPQLRDRRGAVVFVATSDGPGRRAVAQLTETLARELAYFRVRVNAVLAGPQAVDGGAELPAPLGRPGAPDDVASAALFLASPAAAHVTGQVLHVDGGAGLVRARS